MRTASPAAAGPPARPSAPRRVAAAAQDKFCRDVVSTPKPASNAVGTATVSFLGAGGAREDVACAKAVYILDAGLDAGLELPYTCRAGICGACVARVVEGEVDMSDIDDISFTLDEDEVAKGMCLPCMARPVTDSVVLETQSDWGYSLGSSEWGGATGSIQGGTANTIMGREGKEA